MKKTNLPVFKWEELLLFRIANKGAPSRWDRVMMLLSNPYQWIVPFAIFCGVLLWVDWHRGVLAILIGALAGGLADMTNTRLVKTRLQRIRPAQVYAHIRPLGIMNTGQLSFPSNHAANSMAVAVALGLFYPPLVPFLAIIIVLIGYSRIYCGAHYPLDVIAGWLVGGFWGVLLYWGWIQIIETALAN